MMPDVARPDKADNVKKNVLPLLDYGNTFSLIKRKKMAYNVAIKSSETAIRECLCKSKAIYACVGADRLKMAAFIRKSNPI